MVGAAGIAPAEARFEARRDLVGEVHDVVAIGVHDFEEVDAGGEVAVGCIHDLIEHGLAVAHHDCLRGGCRQRYVGGGHTPDGTGVAL